LPHEQPGEPPIQLHCLSLANEHANRKRPHTEPLDSGDALLHAERPPVANRERDGTSRRRPPPRAEHDADIRPVQIGVKESDAQPPSRERHREIDRDRALADTTLATADRDKESRLFRFRRWLHIICD
jgi:hypothetical protein